MRSVRAKAILVLLGGVLALGLLALAWAVGAGSSEAQQGAMHNCPQAGKWAIAIWDGDDGTETGQALATCAAVPVLAAYHLDPETGGWSAWFRDHPDPPVSTLQTLNDMQGVIALGSATVSIADVIFHNGTILTMETDYPEAQAVAIQGEKIVAVGSGEEILALSGPETQVVDLEGRTLLPGFIDSHAHWIGDVDLAGYSTPEEAIQAALENGWTSISELFVNQDRLDELLALDQDGRLRLRVNAYLVLNWQEDRFGDWYQDYQPGQEFSPRLRIGGVKIFMDTNWGTTVFFSQEELNELVTQAHEAGFQIAAHTVGEVSHDLILNAYENALQGESNDIYRHRIEHVVMLRDDQLERMRWLGIIASIQLWVGADCMEELESTIGPDIAGRAARWRDLLEGGVRSIAGTDFPWGCVSPEPSNGSSMKNIYKAVTQIGDVGVPSQWQLDQRITVEQALRLITIDAAYGTFHEDVKGSIAVGKLADLVILSENPLTIPIEQVMDIQVVMTMVGGRVEHCAPGYQGLCPAIEP